MRLIRLKVPGVATLDDAATLVVSARAGDSAAFAHLHARFERLIHAIILARAPLSEVDDLVQETFVRAWEQLSTLREASAFGGWVSMIARNVCSDFLRRNRKVTPIADHHARRDAIDPVAFAVFDAIRELPETYRETLLLRLVEGLTGPEISAQTGLTPDSVRVNLHRGMKLLRERLEGRPDHE